MHLLVTKPYRTHRFTMKVALVALFCAILTNGAFGEDAPDRVKLMEDFMAPLSKESALNFKVIVTMTDYHDNGLIKHIDTWAFKSDHHPSAIFKLNSLGPKRVEELSTYASSKGIGLALQHENFGKNKTKDYGTDQLSAFTSPAAEVITNKDGMFDGILEQLFDILDETTNEAKIEGIFHFPDRKIKEKTTVTIKAKEVVVKESHDFSSKMLEDAKKLIKRAFKVETADRAALMVGLFEEKFDMYKWEVYVNAVTYTAKGDVMAKFKYDDDIYVVLGYSY